MEDQKPSAAKKGKTKSQSESETKAATSGASSEGASKPYAVRIDGIRHVEKGSLTEAELLEDKIRAKKSKRKNLMTEEEQWEERRAANRLAAFQSRQRRKIIIKELQVGKVQEIR
jgi:hypothetical protein